MTPFLTPERKSGPTAFEALYLIFQNPLKNLKNSKQELSYRGLKKSVKIAKNGPFSGRLALPRPVRLT